MRSDTSQRLAPPWGHEQVWREANTSLGDITQRYSAELKPTLALASAIRIKLSSIFRVLDGLCLETCPQCPDPCCLNASPWFDFRDLIFLHLNDLQDPNGQPIATMAGICRYSSTRGCKLPRISRPWICTWYLCPVQTANLKMRRSHQRLDLTRAMDDIKALRKEMEDAFIGVIA